MTTKNQRILAVLLVSLLGMQMLWVGVKNRPERVELDVERPLLVWYTDPEIQEYMETTAEEFSARYQVEVQTELVSEVDYIEIISERSVAESMTGPDLYVASSALLEKAALSGMAAAVGDDGLEDTYSEKAVQAVSYAGRVLARPFYIETCFLLYNRYYTEQIPETIDDILAYAESFEAGPATERVEKIFEWNVADVIDNYMFMGGYTNLGGPSGDDKSQVTMDLGPIEECMAYYQNLNSFFAIDADTVTSEQVVRNFIEGKTVYTIVNVPMLAEVDRAVKEGEVYEYAAEEVSGDQEVSTVSHDPFYGVAELPDLTDSLNSRGLSVTNSVVVNPYSCNLTAAEACARYLTEDRAEQLYEESGKLSACKAVSQNMSEEYRTVYKAYEQAAEVPKIMELSNIWLQLEVVLADIWRGSDPHEELEHFSELLLEQLD